MALNAPNSKELIHSLKKMNGLGRCERTIQIFLSDICSTLSTNITSWVNHSLAVAEVMARLAPKGQTDAWYLVGLLYRVSDIWSKEQAYHTRNAFTALMTKAGFNSGAVFCIENYDKTDDPGTWSPMMAALIYADTHVAKDGEVMPSALCCIENDRAKKKNRERCTACMYAKYYFSCTNELEKCEQILLDVSNELSAAERHRQAGQTLEVSL